MGATDGYTYWIAYSYECSPPVVRLILNGFADAYSPTGGFVIAGYIDALWETLDVADPEWWKLTYHNNLAIQEMTIELEGTAVRVYLANRAWMWQLKLELLGGFVSIGMPFPCKRLVGFG